MTRRLFVAIVVLRSLEVEMVIDFSVAEAASSDTSREKSEDGHTLIRELDATTFVVLDGHGHGTENANVVGFVDHLLQQFQEYGKGVRSEGAMRALFAVVGDRADLYVKQHGLEGEENVGAPAICVVATHSELIIGKIGDCRIEELSDGCLHTIDDHNGDNVLEQRRLQPMLTEHVKLTGKHLQISDTEKQQLYGLAVSRSFGDPRFHPFVIAEPEVVVLSRVSGKLYAITSDGGRQRARNAFYKTKPWFRNPYPSACAKQAREGFEAQAPKDDATIIFFAT